MALISTALDASAFHSNTDPLQIKATKVPPKLSNDHKPGSATLSVDAAA